MKKGLLLSVASALFIVLVACSFSGDKLSRKETNALIGTWECLDEDYQGDIVYISNNDEGLTFQYGDGEGTATGFVSKTKEDGEMTFKFENKKEELRYGVTLQSDGNIIVWFGTTNPEMEGMSKPMEYKLVKK